MKHVLGVYIARRKNTDLRAVHQILIHDPPASLREHRVHVAQLLLVALETAGELWHDDESTEEQCQRLPPFTAFRGHRSNRTRNRPKGRPSVHASINALATRYAWLRYPRNPYRQIACPSCSSRHLLRKQERNRPCGRELQTRQKSSPLLFFIRFFFRLLHTSLAARPNARPACRCTLWRVRYCCCCCYFKT